MTVYLVRLALAALLVAALPLLTGCGTTLHPHALSKRTFVSSEPCAQALELRWFASGNRWGERIQVSARSQSGIGGNVDVYVGGEKHSTSRPSTTAEGLGGGRVEVPARREACWIAPGSPQAPGSGGAPVPQGPLGPGTWRPARTAYFREVPDSSSVGFGFTQLADLDVRVDSVDARPLPAGAEIRIVIWSELPMDWKGTTVTVRHERYWPGDEAEWIAILQEKKREKDAAAARAQAEARQRAEHWRACQASWNQWCTDTFGTPSSPSNDFTPPSSAVPGAPSVSPPSRPPPSSPTSPPPPPRAELVPAKPTPNAEWIGGYWGWSGYAWIWIGGGFRIPPSDIRPAPSPPPPPRAEPPPPPPPASGSGRAWVAGHWVFTVTGWVWVDGGWR